MLIHVVRRGETLTRIAAEYGVNITNLASDNGISVSDFLVTGQALVVQIPEIVHTVRRGETLMSIATAYNTTAIQLLRNNIFLGGSEKITVGQSLVIRFKDELRSRTFAVNSYAYPYINSSLLRVQMPYLTYFTPFTYGITAVGGLVPLNDEELIRIAGEYGAKTLLHLSTLTEGGSFSSTRADLVFDNEEIQSQLIEEIISVTESKGYSGVDVDFEFIDPEKRYDYIRFLQELRLRLNPRRMPLFSALAPKTSDTQKGVLYEGHDYSGIGAAVNFLLLMTYEWGYTFGPPYVAYSTINYIIYFSIKRRLHKLRNRLICYVILPQVIACTIPYISLLYKELRLRSASFNMTNNRFVHRTSE